MFKFRDYQKPIVEKGIQIINKFGIILLAMEVRCGKTLTSFGIAEGIKATNVLFVTKKKIIESKTIQNDFELMDPSFKLKLTNPESLHKIDASEIDLFIIDESHMNGSFPKPSKRTKLLKTLIGSTNVILLSGTPTPESWSQIYHQFYISKNSPFDETNFYKWANNYVEVLKKTVSFGQTVNDYSRANIDLIKEVTDKVIISLTQKEANFKSEIVEKILRVKMKDSTNELIRTLKKDLVFEKDNHVLLGDTPVKLMQKIHQINSGTVKTEAGERLVLDYSKGFFIDRKFKGKKIAIYYKFTAELNLLKRVFGNRITTDLHEFNTTGKNIALQIVSGREGISLKKADYIVYFNIDFSATSYWQSRDRMTSLTRASNTVYWVFAEGGIEDSIYKTVLKKKSFTLSHFKKL